VQRNAEAVGAAKLGKKATIGQDVPHPPPFWRRRRVPVLSALALPVLLGACTELPEGGFSFASAGARDTGLTEVTMTGADVVLAAPTGYCFDKKMLRRDAANGFALLPRCDRLGLGGAFASFGKSAVITATLGKAPSGAVAPSTVALAASVPGANVLDERRNGALPLVKLDVPDHGARGASPEHWRGAFVQDGHVILLALYAPEQSPLLGDRGAELLEQMARRTRAASAPQPMAETAGPAAARTRATTPPPSRTGSGALRPVARGDLDGAAKARPDGASDRKLSLKRRIAGLFD
jgi:hypothetical protein